MFFILLVFGSQLQNWFKDYYGYDVNASDCNEGRVIGVDSAYYVLDCMFSSRGIYIGAGGYAYFKEIKTDVLFEACIFEFIETTDDGGAVFFLCNEAGQIIFDKVCASKCVAGFQKNGQFAYVNTGSRNKNYILHSTISICGYAKYSYFPVVQQSGDISNKMCNFSSNLARIGSGILLNSASPSFFVFSSFHNCSSDQTTVLMSQSSDLQVSSMNFLHNICPKEGSLIITAFGSQGNSPSLKIISSIFFWNSGVLFNAEKGQLSVSKSYILHDGTTTSGRIEKDQWFETGTELYTLVQNKITCGVVLEPTPTRTLKNNEKLIPSYSATYSVILVSSITQTITDTVSITYEQTLVPSFIGTTLSEMVIKDVVVSDLYTMSESLISYEQVFQIVIHIPVYSFSPTYVFFMIESFDSITEQNNLKPGELIGLATGIGLVVLLVLSVGVFLIRQSNDNQNNEGSDSYESYEENNPGVVYITTKTDEDSPLIY